MDWLIAIPFLMVAVLAAKTLLSDDRKAMRKNTREYLDEHYRDKKPRRL